MTMKTVCLISLLLVAAYVDSVVAQGVAKKEKIAGFVAGEKVQMEWAGKTVVAEVVRREPTGWYQVKFEFNGIAVTPTLPPQQLKPVPKEGKADSKPNEKTAPGKSDPQRVPPAGDSAKGLSVTRADWSNVEKLAVTEADVAKIKVEPASPLRGKLTTKPILLTQARPTASRPGVAPASLFKTLDSVLFCREHAAAFAVIVDRNPAQQAVAIQRCDLIDGKVGQAVTLPSLALPIDVDTTGTMFLTHPDASIGGGIEAATQANLLSIWKAGAKGLEHRMTWNPDKGETGAVIAPIFAEFVGPDHVLTVCFPGQLTLWNLASASAIYTVELSPNSRPALSPGKRFVAATIKNVVYVFDALTGKTGSTRLLGSGDIVAHPASVNFVW